MLPSRRFFAMPTAMHARLLLVASLMCAACSTEACSTEASRPSRRRDPAPPPPSPIADAGAWGRQVGALQGPAQALAPSALPLEARTAVMSDEAEASAEPVFVSRLVYRVRFVVPPMFRDRRAVVEAPAGELQLDVSMTRMRARFAGPGWPVDEGTEIRLRSGLPGAYLFDGRGGRSLGAGQLAAWFEGRELGKAKTRVAVRREYKPRAERPMPGELVCALLAEWSNQPRRSLAYRCDAESLPPGFRIGPWTGELTAVVPMELPRRALRADEVDPPAHIPPRRARALLEADAVKKLEPSRPVDEPGPGALVVENQTNTRAIVIAQGAAVGWVESGERLRVEGFTPGWYRIGAIRPLGVLRMPPRLFRVPGTLVIGRDEAE